MKGGRRNLRDQIAGVLFIAVGAAIAWKAQSYRVGPPSDSGPGFFPYYLGLLLAGLGVAITAVASFTQDPEAERFGFRPRTFLGVLLPVVVFGAMLMPMGLVASAFVAVLLSSFASREVTWRGALVNSVTLSVIVLLGFALILKIQIPVWPQFLVQR
ncbi:tripartite tricarboxylate transporter TctB family protein [Roseococcus sp. SYP-B2431]|uniref:tripartite tricarboxylate transporter TctB family protein n=1 Tax=Roseococcus sp. SYP-B2431 TaxID=2496640 RepID=UPI0013F46569|nr:tripartite tricarboxylate transporter TctB family protein [Roseococcus sp. SYP-B2431]